MDPLKNGGGGGGMDKTSKKKIGEENKIKKSKKKKERELFHESSLREIRLMTSPCTRSRQTPSKIVLDKVQATRIHSKSFISLD